MVEQDGIAVQATSGPAYLRGVECHQAGMLSLTCIRLHILRLVDSGRGSFPADGWTRNVLHPEPYIYGKPQLSLEFGYTDVVIS